MAYQPPLPNSSRLIDWGHSWVAPPAYLFTSPYAATNVGMSYLGLPADGEQWPNALRDALGIGSTGSYYKSYVVPAVAAAAATATTFLDYMPADGTIEAIYYVPAGSVSGANTNTRALGLYNGSSFINPIVFSEAQFNAGFSLVQWVPYPIWSMNGNAGQQYQGANIGTTPYLPAMAYTSGATNPTPMPLLWRSTKIGTGGTFADPGGTVIVKFGTRYRNYGVFSANLLGYASYTAVNQYGSWWTPFTYSPWSRPNAPEVNTTTATVATATTINCTALQYPIKNGSIINFASGFSATVNNGGDVAFGATSFTVNALANTIPAASQGHVTNLSATATGAYESLSPSGINCWTHGLNDANIGTQDVPAWTETVRSVIARNCCSAMMFTRESNFATTNGGGTWAPLSAPAGGQIPWGADNYSYAQNSPKMWTGTVSGTPKIDISVGPAFEGGVMDVFLLAVAGSTVGVAGTVTVDGATPPQGSVTFNTSGVSSSGLASRGQTGCSVAAATTFAGTNGAALSTLATLTLGATATSLGYNSTGGTGTVVTSGGSHTFSWTGTSGSTLTGCVYAGTQTDTVATGAAIASTTLAFGASTVNSVDIGKIVINANIPAGTIITAVPSTTYATLSAATTGASGSITATISGYYPMVKRITGLAAGAHKITLTLTGSDSVANSVLILYGLGLETKNPATPVLWCNIARVPNQTSGQKTNTVALNTASAAVIAGTATALTGNTVEPAFGANVQYVDIDTPFGAATPNAALFLPDGIHPNSLGNRLLARTLFSVMRNNFSPDQLMAR